MTPGWLFAAFFVGLLCGAATQDSGYYKAAMFGYILMFGALQAFGIRASLFAVDLLLLAGALLVMFGVARGMIALVWPTTQECETCNLSRSGSE